MLFFVQYVGGFDSCQRGLRVNISQREANPRKETQGNMGLVWVEVIICTYESYRTGSRKRCARFRVTAIFHISFRQAAISTKVLVWLVLLALLVRFHCLFERV